MFELEEAGLTIDGNSYFHYSTEIDGKKVGTRIVVTEEILENGEANHYVNRTLEKKYQVTLKEMESK